MSDLAERTAQRAGDMQAVWVARYRRGACPTCGEKAQAPTSVGLCVCCFECCVPRWDAAEDAWVAGDLVRLPCTTCTLLREEVT